MASLLWPQDICLAAQVRSVSVVPRRLGPCSPNLSTQVCSLGAIRHRRDPWNASIRVRFPTAFTRICLPLILNFRCRRSRSSTAPNVPRLALMAFLALVYPVLPRRECEIELTTGFGHRGLAENSSTHEDFATGCQTMHRFFHHHAHWVPLR